MSDDQVQIDAPPDGDTRSRIVVAAAGLIASGGTDAATTRAVAAAASVQAPTIYRLFGDKDGLLDAVAEHTLAEYVATKSKRELSDNPVADLQHSWDEHVAFGLAHPEVFALMHEARSGPPSSAWTAGIALLQEGVRRIARTGRLCVSEERAVDLIDAGVAGTVLTLSRKSPAERDGLSGAARDAVYNAIIGEQGQPIDTGAQGAASALRAGLDDVATLSPGERQLLSELLQRIAQPPR